MTDQQRPDDLAARFAAYDARLAAQERELARLRRRRRFPRRALPLLLAAVLVALVPFATLAATPFADLTGGPHDGNIEAIYNAQITKGCDTTSYCPTANVTREEMASFLARTAGLGGNPPIANALTAQSAVSAQTATNAQNAVSAQTAASATNATNAANAGNANTVGGYAPGGLVRTARVEIPTTAKLTNIATSYGPPLTIQAPAAGFVLVTGSAALRIFSGNCPCTAYAQLRHLQSGKFSPDSAPSLLVGGIGNASFGWVFPVEAGTNTFELRANVPDRTTTADFFSGQLAALYVPFGSTGAGSLGVDQPEPQPGDKPTKP